MILETRNSKSEIRSKRRVLTLVCLCALCGVTARTSFGVQAEPPPDPGFETAIQAADVIAEVEIIAGGPFRAVAQARKFLKGKAPDVFELEGYNSYTWDIVHKGFETGARFILPLSRTDRPDVLATLTPAAPRLTILADGVLLTLGDPPFRVPIKKSVMEDAIALLVEFFSTGKPPDRAAVFVRGLWDGGDIEPRYLAVALAGALRDERFSDLLAEAGKDKLLKMRLTAVEALGKVNSAQSLAALRALLKDEKPTVAREAARLLVARRDVASLPELLAWVRRSASAAAPANPAGDGTKSKAESAALDVLKLVADAGPLLDPAVLERPLLDLARSRNEALAREALQTLAAIVQPAQIPALLELADDRTYDFRHAAAVALQRATLAPFRDTDDFRTWWTQNSAKFGEDSKRDVVEAIAKLLAKADDSMGRLSAVDLVRMAPGEIALVSVAPLLLRKESTLFSAADIAAWDSALAVPFLLERLGRNTLGERRDALDGLVRLCAAHPRFKTVLWPLIRASLAEDDSTCRRTAQAACGRLAELDGMGALLDAVQYGSGYESQDAGKALYTLTARTLGFSIAEPIPDENAARVRLRGWWESTRESAQPVWSALGPPPARLWPEMESGARNAKLDEFVLAADSRRSAAAFAVAFAERGPGDSFWPKLLAQGRQRDRAHALLGLFGAGQSVAPDLARVLVPRAAETEPPLCRALALVALATLEGKGGGAGNPPPLDKRGAGAAQIVAWLRGLGAKDDVAWRRLGVICLGLADREPLSLAFLQNVVSAGLAAQVQEEVVTMTFTDEPPADDDRTLLLPAVSALCARTDTDVLLSKIVEESKNRYLRETAARALALRRAVAASATVAKALEKAERYDWQGLCRVLEPVLKPADASLLNGLMDRADTAPRSAGAYLFALHPDVGNDADTRGHLVMGLADASNIVRYYSAAALGKRRSMAAIKKLVELLRDDEDEVRAAAAEALGLIGDLDSCKAAAGAAALLPRPDVRYLRAMAIAGEEMDTRLLLKLCESVAYADQRAGYEALAASRTPVALQMLLKTFRNDEAGFQTVAADSLTERGDATVAALQSDLASKERKVRARTVHLFSRINTAASRAALTKAQNDDDASIRILATFALQRLAGAKGKDADAR